MNVAPEALLRFHGEHSSFRPLQREAVAAALQGLDVLLVMATGSGKSLCYQLPALASENLTVVISPLIALINDQVAKLRELNLPAVGINSNMSAELVLEAERAIGDGTARLLFVSPERLADERIMDLLQTRGVERLVVDEAHCIAEWGHDFRPDYLRIHRSLELLGRPPLSAMTATATPRVASEIERRLHMKEPVKISSAFDRPNIAFDVLPCEPDEKVSVLQQGLRDRPGLPSIVYCGTRGGTEAVAAALSDSGFVAVHYHAGLGADERQTIEQDWRADNIEVMVATNAFGMGVDKADVRSVWHYDVPTSLEQYYQEAGRAGRDGREARAALLFHSGDLERLVYFINNSRLSEESVAETADALNVEGGELPFTKNAGNSATRLSVHVLEQVGTVEIGAAQDGGLVARKIADLDDSASRRAGILIKEVYKRKWDGYRTIKEFAADEGICRRVQLIRHFGDEATPDPIGRCCDICDGRTLPKDPSLNADPPRSPSAASASRDAEVGSNGERASHEAEGAEPSRADERFEQLRVWRLQEAGDLPAFCVATDETLKEIVRRCPTTESDLLCINGMGPARMEKHGPSLLQITRGWLRIDGGSTAGLEINSSSTDRQIQARVKALRAWRKEEAAREGWPPFRVMWDQTLERIAIECPANERSLRAVKGVGPWFVERYADAVLSILAPLR